MCVCVRACVQRQSSFRREDSRGPFINDASSQVPPSVVLSWVEPETLGLVGLRGNFVCGAQ